MEKKGTNDFRGTGTAVTKAIDDDVVIAYVNADDKAAGDDVGVSEFDSATGYRNVVVVSDTNSKKVVAIFVESSRNADILGAKVADIVTDSHTCESDEQHKTEAKSATCTEKGNVAYYTCTVTGCGKHYQEVACTNEIADVETAVDSTAHPADSVTWTHDDTNAGNHKGVCSDCNASDLTGTCDAEGTDGACSKCGHK